MNKDTREELERLESALLAEETDQTEDLEEFLDGLLDEPTDSLAQTGSVVYNNFANGYGQQDEEDFEDYEEETPEKSDSLTGLMFTAAGLLLGIGAVLVYWVVRFL